MIIISGGRGIGKTKMLLEQAADNSGTVVCADPDIMRDRAYKYGITGLDIISYKDFAIRRDFTVSEKSIYIHDINKFLKETYGNIKGYSQCTE